MGGLSAIAVIPARGGSKRIPGKNIKDFCGQPIIAKPIAEAIRSRCFDRVIVSTDSPEIAEVAKQYGAEVPFIRPANLSDDHTVITAVIAHATRWVIEHIQLVSNVCCIYPTAPFLQAEDLRRGLRILEETSTDYALSVTNYTFPIQRAIRINENKRLEMFHPEYVTTRSQDLDEAWHDAGQFCWGRANAWLEMRPVLAGGTTPIVIPHYRVQDIDTLEDWQRAEILFGILHRLERNWDVLEHE